MRCPWVCRVLCLHLFLMLAASHVDIPLPSSLFSNPARLFQPGEDLSMVYPIRVDGDNQFVSHSLSYNLARGRSKRDVRPFDEHVYFRINLKGRELFMNLTVNNHLLSNDYILERRNGSLNRTEHHSTGGNSCHLIGTVTDSVVRGIAAITTCVGLQGVFSLPEGSFFIEPSKGGPADREGGPQPHLVYPHVTAATPRRRGRSPKDTPSPCGVRDAPADFLQVEREREEWEREEQGRGGLPDPRRVKARSVSRERWVETMVVVDSKLITYHGSENVEAYIFTIMNMVAGIFHDASIGNAIHIVLVRLILLQAEEKGLKIVHHADSTLSSFCAWQKGLNPQSDTHPAHHDVAVLVTRKDICAGQDRPCETLGLSHLSGMCQPHRSCNINEDSGLPVAFTIAHEMGHSFGIYHDGQGNDCELAGRHPFIMSRQLMYDTSPLTWSSCSKEYITRFLDRGWGFCLDDRPSKRDLTTPLARLGVRYTTHYQCQLQYGPNATFCPEVDNVCQVLWCSVNGSCRSKLDSPIDGTRCGPEKWCISGECVIVGKLPETVNGAWGVWSTWSHCSRTCGAGVQSADRECNNPKPEFGGKYCTGERKRYRVCNTRPCQKSKPTFREMLCSEFNTVPYQNELYEWIPVASSVSPCELHCRPVGEGFSEKMLDAVTDGTPCFMNNNSRNICVNGVCKEVGCDFGIDSNAVEDSCGVCLGDGSSCEVVQHTFQGGEGFGYVDVGLIPEGARDVKVQEVEEAGNFLALRGHGSEEYFLNGNYIIQWNGEYEAGGATFFYERLGNLENLTSAGPIRQPVMIQLLYQERNPGIKYEYTIKRSRLIGNEVISPEYRWKLGAWTDCSTSCGIGEQLQPIRCFELEVGVVDESLCDPDSRPEDNHRMCKNRDCPARWWVGGWQACSASCGSEGVRKRTVLCVRTVSGEERVLHPVECKHLIKPKPAVPCNRDLPCGPDWAVGNWSTCPVTCGGSVRSRMVTCLTAPKKPCDLSAKPRSKSLCALQACPNSSLRRRPGPPPNPRHLPNRPPTSRPVEVTHSTPRITPGKTTTPVQKTTTPIPTTTRPSTTTSDIIDADEFQNRLKEGMNGGMEDREDEEEERDEEEREEEREEEEREEEESDNPDKVEEEEGSTEDSGRYNPGYDYVVEDMTTTGQPIIDLDVVSSATSTTQQTTSTPARSRTVSRPTPRPGHTTRAPPTTSLPLPHRNTHHWGESSLLFPSFTPSPRRNARVPPTSPRPLRANSGTRVPPRETPQPPTKRPAVPRTPPPPHPTLRIAKAPKTPISAPPSKQLPPRPRDPTPSPKGQEQRPGSPVVTFTSDYGNLNATEPISMEISWEVGNWSECSTSCGVGAVWRTVRCSSGQEEDCSGMKRPDPARTCHLRPCATWVCSNWTKCPAGCEVEGHKQRDVHCVDTQSRRPLRPFHCQVVSPRPPSSLSCPAQTCLAWKTSPWGQCSRTCGEGVRERLVFCEEPQRCSAPRRPNSTEPCSLQPCSHWEPQPWEKCSTSCGDGVQQREVRCVREGDLERVTESYCDTDPRPVSKRTCKTPPCHNNNNNNNNNSNNTGPGCKKNAMSSRFCDKLMLLGRCSLRSIQKQCCMTCRS